MSTEFQQRYLSLNDAQKRAVDTIDGPVLVVAGPGTGKTELLSLRVANILQQTDVDPSNILCLTFTDNASRNMRDRLSSVIGQSAYHVAIHTFHSFGSEVISRYAAYFTKRQLLQQIDELGRYELLRGIFESLPHSNPLSVRLGDDFVHIKDVLQAISWFKQNALTPPELRQLLKRNALFMSQVADQLATAFEMTASPKQLKAYEELLVSMQKLASDQHIYGFPDYAQICARDLASAIEATAADGRYAPAITAWRNQWCQKGSDGKHQFKDTGRNHRKLLAVIEVYEALHTVMAAQGLFDFDDMIIEVVQALEQDNELRLNLQERYQYILVDEFQDTNKAQLRMLNALGDNPVYEERPNIMAVGDDDQAIYAFQGADVSNMLAFAQQYKRPLIVALTDNYRSTEQILQASFGVAEQITDRFESQLTDTHKQLNAQTNYELNNLAHTVFTSELAQYDWLAEQIATAIEQGTAPEAIAVIAPRHRYLERLMPYLGQRHIPVAYERREDILEAPIIMQLLTMTSLVVAIADQRHDDSDVLLSEVLAYDFWQVPTEALMELSLDCYNQRRHWLDAASSSQQPLIVAITQWFMQLAKRAKLEPLEYILDQLMGGLTDAVDSESDEVTQPTKHSVTHFVSPMREFYFNPESYEQSTDSYLTLLGQLSTLRQRLREWKPTTTLYATDLVVFAELHRAAGLKVVDTNPHTQTTNAVQVMTAYKAKGLEFEMVFVTNVQDEIWGPTARSRSSTISLPRNLPLAPASDGDNDKLRLLFVALTRAKHSLQLTSYTHNLDNKLSPGLSYITDIPAFDARPSTKPTSTKAVEILSTDWVYRFRQIIADKPTLFEPILANYKLSVTHLNNFTDVTKDGPHYFLLHNLLRFPQAPTPAAAYGDAVHKTLQWAHTELRNNDSIPDPQQLQDYFADMLQRKHLRKSDFTKLEKRGRLALSHYFEQRGKTMVAKDLVERGFNNEGVVIAEARLSGKIDKLHYETPSSVQVIDFKTGRPATNWRGKADFEKLKLHKYRQQLLFYKLLVEQSASFSRKLTVSSGGLEFIEAANDGTLVNNLVLHFDTLELERYIKLIGSVWRHIMNLDFPDVSHYPQNFKGVQQFEQDLIDESE